ncbi:IS200/IS605 family element transposase accessory protein TnpB [Trichocoleus sp. FACHB-90]|uniref:RNA-guided endonuclease InsQ/TnpB family protein n=1 Tax=Cyanophyceae TaxID=3028117 RepID=UPI0016841D78|nr:RNA-guided endonuclease TnpB family protein [Trichocoleus sp. FACHB-90]MBD1925498.1 IS200/IS605 family element transposase accessory protein TnpB [Trichocoleus sp. FACHB-90]
MILGFKTELKLNNSQRTVLLKHVGTARHAYNWGLWFTKNLLSHNKANPEEKVKFPSAIDLHKLLVASVKPQNPWYYEASKSAPQFALGALREAWDSCFKKKSGVPRFKKKGLHDSFTLDGTIKIVNSHKIQVPVIGALKTYEQLPTGIKPKSVTISRQSDKWFISFKIELEAQTSEKTNLSVGVDLGVKELATLSNGEAFSCPKEYRQIKAKIAKLQYLSRHQEKGSSNRKKFTARIASLYYKAACIRKDNLHKLTTHLAKNFKVICIEDLNVRGMMANHKLAGSIGDMGFYEFRRQLEYKCKLYGSELVVISRWEPSSKIHHRCNWKNEGLTLKDRIFYCPCCDESIDRDLNAALNIERSGLSLSSLRLVDGVVPTPPVEASKNQFV